MIHRRNLPNRRNHVTQKLPPVESLAAMHPQVQKVGDLFARAKCVPSGLVTEDVQSFHLLEAA
jgi:hypothetical protein